MTRVLVTGATGFIGMHVVPRLVARGWDVHAIVRTPPAAPTPGVTFHEADLLSDASAVIRDVAASHLLHLAWYAEHGLYWRSAENFRWVAASLALVRAFADAGGRRVVAAGTCAEYDWTGDGICREDATPLAPATTYGVCKDALRRMLDAFARETGVEVAWGRIFFTFGPGEHADRLVPSVIRALLRGEEARTTHGMQVRDFLAVEDVADAFVALVESNVTGAVNIASGEGLALRDVVEDIASHFAAPRLAFGAIAAPANEPPRLVADVARLRDDVGFRTDVSRRERIASAVAWWRERERAA